MEPQAGPGASGAQSCKSNVYVCEHPHTWTHVCSQMHLLRSSPSASRGFHLPSTFTSAGAPTTCFRSLWCFSELESPADGLLPEDNAGAAGDFRCKGMQRQCRRMCPSTHMDACTQPHIPLWTCGHSLDRNLFPFQGHVHFEGQGPASQDLPSPQ